jgi:hypothetical protein
LEALVLPLYEIPIEFQFNRPYRNSNFQAKMRRLDSNQRPPAHEAGEHSELLHPAM